MSLTRYLKPSGGGYKDVLMNFSHEIVNEDGKTKHVVVELQLLTAAMNQMKNAGPGHALYEATRTIRPHVLDKQAYFGRGRESERKIFSSDSRKSARNSTLQRTKKLALTLWTLE